MTTHSHVADAALSVVSVVAPVGVVVAWLFEKLPSIAALVSIAFIVWQWRRMVKKDRLEAAEREKSNVPESNTAG
jgi:hypothetical protein